jgi:hypothetical protein
MASFGKYQTSSFVSLLVLALSWFSLDKGCGQSVKTRGQSFSNITLYLQECETHFWHIATKPKGKTDGCLIRNTCRKISQWPFQYRLHGGADGAMTWNPCSICLVWYGLGFDDLLRLQMAIATIIVRPGRVKQTKIRMDTWLGDVKFLTNKSSKTWWDVMLAAMPSLCFLIIAICLSIALPPELVGLIWVGWMDQIPIQGAGLPVLFFY